MVCAVMVADMSLNMEGITEEHAVFPNEEWKKAVADNKPAWMRCDI